MSTDKAKKFIGEMNFKESLHDPSARYLNAR